MTETGKSKGEDGPEGKAEPKQTSAGFSGRDNANDSASSEVRRLAHNYVQARNSQPHEGQAKKERWFFRPHPPNPAPPGPKNRDTTKRRESVTENYGELSLRARPLPCLSGWRTRSLKRDGQRRNVYVRSLGRRRDVLT